MIPDDDFVDWLFSAATWALNDALDPSVVLGHERPLLPVFEDFPVDGDLQGHDLALDYLSFVEAHSGTDGWEWALELVPDTQPSVTDALADITHHMTSAPQGGSYEGGGDELLLVYDPTSVASPERLVAVLSRGVAHWMCAHAESEPPDGEEAFDLAVDVAWVLNGFGVFASNTAFESYAHESGIMVGWGYRRFGALGQLELSYALGLFCELIESDDREARAHLSDNPRAWLREARKDLRTRHAERVTRLRSARLAGDGPYRTG